MARQRAEIVQLKPDIDRIIAAITYAIDAANRLGKKPTQYDVVKSLFLADRSHLNEFGRLVSSDRYLAMKHGPVPSTAYNVLKSDEITMRRWRIESVPWLADREDKDKWIFHSADVSAVDAILAPSDKAAIDAAVTTVTSLSFGQVRRLTHQDAAYIEAWEDGGKQFAMSLGLLFDVPDFERARQLSEMSHLQ